MTMTEFEKAQLELLREQIAATRENTAAFAALSAPRPMPGEFDRLNEIRRGGPKKVVGQRTGIAPLVDAESGDVVAPEGIKVSASYQIDADGRKRIIEATADYAPIAAHFGHRFDREHAQEVRDSSTTAIGREDMQIKREKFVERSVYLKCVRQWVTAAVGKSPDDLGPHVVRWDEPAPDAVQDEASP
jgi:hypothetical protein